MIEGSSKIAEATLVQEPKITKSNFSLPFISCAFSIINLEASEGEGVVIDANGTLLPKGNLISGRFITLIICSLIA